MPNKRVAIIFFGLTRTLSKTIHSIRENLFKPLLEKSIDYDIFIHTFKIDGSYHNGPAGEHTNDYHNEDVESLLKPKYYISDNQADIESSININDYYTHLEHAWGGGLPKETERETTKYLIRNLCLALYSKNQITKLFETHKNEYDYAIITRPEQAIVSKINIDLFNELQDNNIIIPSDDGCSGVNDRFCIGKPNTIIYYGTLFEHLKEYSLNPGIFTSERYVLDKLIEKKINIILKKINLQLIRI
jgi:hypothetical protein